MRWDKDRFYRHEGKLVPSGTTVLGKPYLADWAANCAVDYLVSYGLVDYGHGAVEFSKEEIAIARTGHKREAGEAADYGTFIHSLCEVSLMSKEHGIRYVPLLIESPHKMTQSFMKQFRDFCIKHDVKPIAIEHEFTTERYGGRLDLVCEMDAFWMTEKWCAKHGYEWNKDTQKQRVIVLIDFKTGAGTYYDSWKYQLSGYRQGWNDMVSTNYAVKPYCRDRRLDEKHAPWLHGIANLIQHHAILKFNKKTDNMNFKCFTKYEATRPIMDKPRVDGKPQTEKYIRTYADDLAVFNNLVDLWWSQNIGAK